mmetsp:Transcript_12957/g.14348  ORF Transcript_12957/g.14348 Transcript_12957/m.14348 type:complete len:659 (-) Transcript_12957:41-2017(-)
MRSNAGQTFSISGHSVKLHEGMAEYDIIVDIDSIVNGNKGWPLYISQNLRQRLQDGLYQQATDSRTFTSTNDAYSRNQDMSDSSSSTAEDLNIPEEPERKETVVETTEEKEEEDDDGLTNELLKLLDLDSTNTIVSVSGLFNRGKTFILNKLAKTKLPSDFKVTTKGLSFILPQDDNVKNLIFLDTAGRNSPLSLSTSSVLDKVLAEKKTTELFMQDLIFDMSDVIIVVVNQLTFHDQEYLSVLRDKLKQSEKEFKKIYVVHNFHDVTTEPDLLTMWRKYVLFAYEGTQKSVQVQLPESGPPIARGATDARYFVTKDGSMTHVFLANDFSKAGQYWNPRTFELLRTWLKGKHSSDDVPLHHLLIKSADKYLRHYCKGIQSVRIKTGMQRDELMQSLRTQQNFRPEYRQPVQPPVQPQPVARPPPQRRGRQKRGEVVQPPPPPPTYKPLDATEWDKPPTHEDTEMVKMPEGILKLTVSGDMSLKREKVTFNGYHITLEQSNMFQPKVDTIDDPAGMLILVDLPGFRPFEEEDENPDEIDDFVTGGMVDVWIDRPTRQLMISGSRKLSYPVVEKVEGEYDFGEITSYVQSRGHERPTGKFERRVQLPHDIELDSDPLFTLDEGQGVIFLKKAKKRRRIIPKRARRSKRKPTKAKTAPATD